MFSRSCWGSSSKKVVPGLCCSYFYLPVRTAQIYSSNSQICSQLKISMTSFYTNIYIPHKLIGFYRLQILESSGFRNFVFGNTGFWNNALLLVKKSFWWNSSVKAMIHWVAFSCRGVSCVCSHSCPRAYQYPECTRAHRHSLPATVTMKQNIILLPR